MVLTQKQTLLLEFVKEHHKDQVRKYTGEPYWTHPLAVAEIVNKYLPKYSLAIEGALCHDLFEDTGCTKDELFAYLMSIGYTSDQSLDIVGLVVELTDIYTHEDYPQFNRKRRKQLEAERLGKTSVTAQSIKYSDLIDNTKSIVKYDKSFAKVYLSEKEALLDQMKNGHKDLCTKAYVSLWGAKQELKNK